jgi:hypothetical protein
MSDFLTNIPLIRNLTELVEWLLLLNVVLTGAVILLAFRATHYKKQAEELEVQLHEAIGATIAEHIPEENVPHKRAARR